MTDELLLPGLTSADPAVDALSNEEVKTEVQQDPKDEFRNEYRKLLDAAHESLGDQSISDLGLDHKYWRLMNEARTYAHVKGL